MSVVRPQSPDLRQETRTSSAGGRALSPPTRQPWSPVVAEVAPATRKLAPPTTAPKKDVTSKIASLWKKVEESKQKQHQVHKKDGTKDKRVWISRGGKPQQEGGQAQRDDRALSPAAPPGRLIRSGTYEKLNTDQLTTVMSAVPVSGKELKPRSRSRLSIKLSKFGLSKRKVGDEDTANGNHQPARSPDTDELGNSFPTLSSPVSNYDGPADNAGDFGEHAVDIIANHDQRMAAHPFRSSSASSSRGSLAAAVVAPFNYTPSSNGTTTLGIERIKSAAQIKRNSSYVSSMGRKREEGDVSPVDEDGIERRGRKPTSPMTLGAYTGNTSSSVVTLV